MQFEVISYVHVACTCGILEPIERGFATPSSRIGGFEASEPSLLAAAISVITFIPPPT